MNSWKGFAALTVAMVASQALTAVPALAQEAPRVTLKASRPTILFGRQVRLSGSISPPTEEQAVNILDQDGRVRTTTITDAEGRFSAVLRPRANSTLRAQWVAAVSEPVTVKVRPLLRIRLPAVTLFAKTRVRGTLRPAHEGDSVTVSLRRDGRLHDSRKLKLRSGRWFSGLFRISKPGRYRAVVSFRHSDHLPAKDWSTGRSTPVPRLSVGSRGRYVKLLEERLDELGYLLLGVDRRYDSRTSDAVIAFNKVQRRSRVGSVDESTWHALASPKRPHAKYRKPRFHVEVDQTRQVVYFFERGRPTMIVHASTGAGGATHDGIYTFFREISGYSGGGLYYPTYFDGLRAIHGWPDVPTYPASHGCVRVPMWAAKWIHDRLDLGDRIYVYH
jgi:N-acetylmuramoyl-L-alanine amidase